MPLAALRVYLLCLGLLAAATALVLDGVMLRYVLQPLVRFIEARSPQPALLPPGMRFMLDHTWARRTYNATFAVIALGTWWYLGTTAGAHALR
jgi:hypothetical protein